MNTRVINRNMFYGANSGTFEKATLLRKNMTLAELVLWKKLKDRKLFETKFRRQHPIDIFIVDFYNHEFKLVIEIDGEIHQNKEVIEYDSGRTYELERLGIKVINFSNDQVIYELNSVIEEILKIIRELAPFQ
jgi:very-short-patch-repair endonuclease